MSFEVSVIVPNYNNAKYLEKCIRSIYDQSFKNFEIILIDDNSSDNPEKEIKKYKNFENFKFIKLKKNKGPAFVRNLGMRKSKNEYVAFLDSDDFWLPNKLEKQINFMRLNNYSFTFTDYFLIKKINKDGPKKVICSKKVYDFETFVKDTTIGTSTIVIKKNLIKNLKFKNTLIMEDYLFKCEILKKKTLAYNCDEVLTGYRITPNSRNSKVIRNIKNLWGINDKYLKFSFFKNLKCIIFVIISSLKKYGANKYLNQ